MLHSLQGRWVRLQYKWGLLQQSLYEGQLANLQLPGCPPPYWRILG